MRKLNSTLYGLTAATKGFIASGAGMLIVNEIINYCASLNYVSPAPYQGTTTGVLEYLQNQTSAINTNINEDNVTNGRRVLVASLVGAGVGFIAGYRHAEKKAEAGENLPFYQPLMG